MIKLIDILSEVLTEKKLCPKGRAYYNRRISAGEKPSAYLSGRAVKVCKGLMKEDDYFTGSKFGDDEGNEFSVEQIYNFVKKDKTKYYKSNFPLDKIKHNIEWWNKNYNIKNPKHKERMMNADTSFPLLVIIEKNGNYSVADGLNRLYKAIKIENKKTLPIYLINKSEIEQFSNKLMKEFLNEEIDPSEAYNDTDAINTLVDKKRDLAFIVQDSNTDENWANIQKIIKDNNIKVMYVRGNPHHAYIAYLPGSENKATQLKDLAEKYDGYLSAQATKEDTIKMGRLLGYKEDKIKEYVNKNFPNDPMEESLRDWFKKEDWVRIDTQGNITGPCGTMKKGKATTRCLPRAKANRLTKAERAATARKKVAGSKKGKQFVANTKKAKVKLNKENLDEMSLKQGLAAAGIALSTLLGTPDTSKASTPTSISQVAAKSIIEKVVKGFEKEGYKIDFLETAKYKNFNNASEDDIKVEFGAAKTESAARLTLMQFIKVNKLDRNKTLFMLNPEEEQFIIIYTKK